MRIAFELLPARSGEANRGGFRDGDDVVFRFTITDPASGAGVPKAHPAAWMAPRAEGETRDALAAAKTIASVPARATASAAPTLDLNVFYALTMNDDATVTVVDPLFGFGNTKLLAMVLLKGNAVDWALSDDQSRLYLATPSTDRITVVDTATWSESAVLTSIRHPSRLALQPDGHYLWAASGDPSPTRSGVAAIGTDGPTLVRTIPTGRGDHAIAFDGDGREVFVTNRDDGTVSVIEISTLARVADIATGRAPVSLAYSPASRMIYVADAVDGTITIVSPQTLKVVGRAHAEPGLSQLRFAPGGRLGFAVNPEANAVHILDAASGRVVHTVDTEQKASIRPVFAGGLAYLRHRDSANVRIIPLDGLGVEGRPVAVVDFPAGQRAPSARNAAPCFADAICPAPGDDAVLVANPADRTIYYYKQGMSAPQGSFSSYGRIPRGVLTVDRSLQERRPGVYETHARLGPPGDFNLAFLLDTPRITHLFNVKVNPDPERSKRASAGVVVTPIDDSPTVTAGKPVRVRFRLSDRKTNDPTIGLTDVSVLVFSRGGWQRRLRPSPLGRASPPVELTPPRPGAYYLYAEAPSAGIDLNHNWFLTLEAKEPDH